MRHYKVRHAASVTHDLDLIEEYLFQVYNDLGDDPESAMARVAARIDKALISMRTFEGYPCTEHKEIRTGIRTVTSDRSVFTFEINEPLSEVRLLAVFFGGVDHRRQILERLRP